MVSLPPVPHPWRVLRREQGSRYLSKRDGSVTHDHLLETWAVW
jgi:hypothetical protein